MRDACQAFSRTHTHVSMRRKHVVFAVMFEVPQHHALLRIDGLYCLFHLQHQSTASESMDTLREMAMDCVWQPLFRVPSHSSSSDALLVIASKIGALLQAHECMVGIISLPFFSKAECVHARSKDWRCCEQETSTIALSSSRRLRSLHATALVLFVEIQVVLF